MAAALIFVPGAMPSFDRNGNTCVAELYFYANDGTYAPKTVYTASDLATPLPFPVVSDASGMFPAIWADGAQQFTVSWRTREADPSSFTLPNVSPATGVIVGPGTGDMLGSNNLSDLQSPVTALANLGGLPKTGGALTGPLTLAADAVNPLEPATKQQLDSAITNTGKRQRVRAATTANITISTALNNADVLDGVTLATGDLVLVKDQSTASQNGVYVVGVTPVRASEFDTWAEFPGSLIVVAEGTDNADTMFLCTSNDGGTLGTTAIVFARIRIDIAIPVPVSQGGTGLTNAGMAGQVLTSNGTGFALTAPVLPGWDFIAQDERASGTGAGTSAAAAFQDRDISAVKRNVLGLAVTSTSFTITPGIWHIKASAPCSGCGGRVTVSDASIANFVGIGDNALAATGSMDHSHVEGYLTVASNTQMFVKHYTTAAVTNGLGLPLSASGAFEIYAKVYAKKIA